jgi:O-antigen ligase
MGLALIFSMSRMGIVAMLCGIGTMILAGKIFGEAKRTTVMGIALVCLILGFAAYAGIDAVLARFESLGQAGYFEENRISIWRDAWNMAKEHWILGEGLGTFRWSFPAYERIQSDIPARYAHNDYLQVLSEVGIIGLALLIWAFAAAWRVAARNLRNTRDALTRGIGLASIGALTAAALQEITDFSLYIPGVAVLLVVLMGLNIRAASGFNESAHCRG